MAASHPRRSRARALSLPGRLWAVARYEIAWDRRKFWIYGSAGLLILILGTAYVFAASPPPGSPSSSSGLHQATFEETGLPPGTPWVVSVGTTEVRSTSANITFPDLAGSNPFTVGTLVNNVTAYVAAPLSGTVQVAASDVSVSVSFTPASTGPGPFAYDVAKPLATTAANAEGGNWTPIFRGGTLGVDDPQSWTNTTTPNNGVCDVAGGTGRWPTVPAWTGNYSQGLASVWQFEFYQASSGSDLFVEVAGGQATLVGVGANSTCGRGPSAYQTLPWGTATVDSTQAAKNLSSADAAFAAAHPQARAVYALEVLSQSRFSIYGELVWLIGFTTCPDSSGGMAGSAFLATVAAATGQVLNYTTSNGTCPAPTNASSNYSVSGALPVTPGGPLSTPAASGTPSLLPHPFAWLDLVFALTGIGFLPLAMVLGGTSASESIARERDKGTLAALFQQPVRRAEVLLGKWLEKLVVFLILSAVLVGAAIGVSTASFGPQADLVWAPLIVAELALTFVFFATVALLFGCFFKRSKSVSGLLWLVVIAGILLASALRAPAAYFVPGIGVWLALPATRIFLLHPAGGAYVTSMPQSFVLFLRQTPIGGLLSWGSASTGAFALGSIVGLVLSTAAFLLLGMLMTRRLDSVGGG